MSKLFDIFNSTKKEDTNSSANTVSNGTTTPIVPDWALGPTQEFTKTLTDYGHLDPRSLVAGTNPQLDQAGAMATNLTGSPWNFDAAADLTRGVAGAATPTTRGVRAQPFMDDYLNPYLKDVVNSTSADLDAAEGRQNAQQDLNLAGSNAFGGSGAALTRSATIGEQNRARGSVLGNLRNTGWNTALGAAQSDADRLQQAKNLNAQLLGQGQDRTLRTADQLAGLSTASDANSRANISSLSDIGNILRQITQQTDVAPLTLTDYQINELDKLGLGKFFGQNSQGTTNTTKSSTDQITDSPSDASKVGQALQIAATVAAMFSDRRLKTDVTPLGRRPDGLMVYLYRYLWSPVLHVGVMAQEALGIRPEAVVVHPSGFLMVDYGRL